MQDSPEDQDGNHPVALQFDFVDVPGTTTVVTSSSGPTPTGFTAYGDYYEISTDVAFTGEVKVCITYDPDGAPDPVTLYHHDGTTWQPIGTSVTPGVVCGMTSSFSPFVLGVPAPVHYPWSGFLDPVSNTKVNTEFAGSIIPIRFRVGGDQGLDVIVPGGAASGVAACTVGAMPASTQAATTPLGVKLQYVKASKTYWYFWQTKTNWAGTCRTFVLTLEDGSVHTASFKFVKLTLGNLLRAILRAV